MEEFVKSTISDAMNSHVENAVTSIQSGTGSSIGTFQELQVRAISHATSEIVDRFDTRREQFYNASDGVEQAAAFKRAARCCYHSIESCRRELAGQVLNVSF